VNIIYELPDFWVENDFKIECNSTSDYIFDENLIVII